ncbi:50S ribosomal protein L27 [Patescibacteria group bacterium]
MAHRKAGGTAKNVRDSNPKYRGVKLSDGQKVKAGAIIIRQKGNKFWPGENVKQGKDFTLFSQINGTVKFSKKRKTKFNGKDFRAKIISVGTMPNKK